MHRPTTRRPGRLRALVVVLALAVSMFAAVLPANAAPPAQRVLADSTIEVEASPNSWVWTQSWVWTRGGQVETSGGSVTTQSWVWTR